MYPALRLAYRHVFTTIANLYSQLELLPEELLQLIVSYLPTPALKNAALASSTLYHHATDFLWQNVCLVDQRTLHSDNPPNTLVSGGMDGATDEHDDTPIIQKLFILATNPTIASKVHILTHCCHLPTPNIFDELPRMHFDAENLSQDARLHDLLSLAIKNLVSVHTLRIVHGHMRLTSSLVTGFLDPDRSRRGPLRKLWLENCSLSPRAMHVLATGNLIGLESLRVRRLDAAGFFTTQKREMDFMEFRLSRGALCYVMHDGAGNWSPTTVHLSPVGLSPQPHHQSEAEMMGYARDFDADLWRKLPEIEELVAGHAQADGDEMELHLPTNPMRGVLEFSFSTLTSLNLDWILWRRKEFDILDESAATLKMLATMRFPQLRAFQLRNAVMQQTQFPDGVYLLEDNFLNFLEYHHKLQCLAWPIDRFYGHFRPSVDVQSRSRRLIAHLANILTDLRIDAQYAGSGEPLTDASQTIIQMQERIRRRRFIAEFAPHMRQIECIKMEGGLPRDEKRELLRALHWCPLKKIVMIGVCYPVGNTWGPLGLELKALDEGSWDDMHTLEGEDHPGIAEAYRHGFHMADNFEFEPDYGWPAVQAPLLQTIALHHTSSVEELKLCGFNGCPILSHLTPITDPLLIGLRQFDNLKQLVMSFWLLTWYESSYRDTEIIKYWMDSRSPSSTALVVVTPPRSPSQDSPVNPGHFPNFNAQYAPPPQFNRWAVALKTSFSPSALAYRVARDIGPYLSPVAKNRPGGVRVRASFCLGCRDDRRPASDIFDLDVRIGKHDQVLEFIGPREEGEKSRWWQKLESRRWF